MEYFSVGRVLSRSFGLVRDSIGTVGLFQLILVGCEFLVGLAVSYIPGSSTTVDTGALAGIGTQSATSGSGLQWLTLLVTALSLALGWAGGMYGLIEQHYAGKTSLQTCFGRGFARMFPVLGLTILWWLGVAAGYMFFVIPSLMLMSAWAVAVPALVGEGIGVIDSFGRSRDLTRNHRLPIFGVLFIILIGWYGLTVLLMGGAGSALAEENFEGFRPLILLVAIPAGWASSMLVKAVLVSTYLECVEMKEGSPTGELTEVFN